MGEVLTKEQLDVTTAEWRERCAAVEVQTEKRPPRPFSGQHNTELITAIMKGIAPYIHDLEKQVAALQTRIEELERKGYVGVWKDGKEYTPQSEVTHEGARWIAHKRTSDKPGASADWSLMEKSAVNPRSDTGTVNARSNGHYARPRP
jgi:hypothetical protein